MTKATSSQAISEWQKMHLVKAEFTEVRILRLVQTKPNKIDDLQKAKDAQRAIKKLRSYLCDTPPFVIGRTKKPEKGWNLEEHVIQGKDKWPCAYYLTTSSRIAKVDLLIEDLDERIGQLEAEERQAAEEISRSTKASMKFARVVADKALAGALWHALDTAPPTTGYVYLKRWSMPDGSCWFKVGITNNPDRRDVEQNVLPVAAETISCVDVGSMDRARAIEAIIHQVLDQQRITDASNRELFHLSPQQASAVKAVLERLE